MPSSSAVEISALDELARSLGERLAAAGLDLDLAADQLAGGVRAERAGVCERLQILIPVDEVVRVRVEELELLLDAERQVGRAREDLAGRVESVERVVDALAHRLLDNTSALAQVR
jgi:hypothetical protein